MNTKGANIILWIFEILAVILIATIIISVSTSLAKGNAIQKINTAQDLVMMVNTLVGVPGDVLIEYPHNVKDYKFVLSSDNIIIFSPGDTELQRVQRNFRLPEGYGAEGFVDTEEKVCFTKQDKIITLEACP